MRTVQMTLDERLVDRVDDHVQTVARGRVGALLTTLSPQRMAEIREALLFALDF
jgi:mRNA-degrading endonuclease toxin of MazEF toxin-antitoxin module